MATNLEKAKIMLVLARRKGNWGEKYDRLEHFKRFQNLKILRKRIFKPSDVKSLCLKEIIKELSKLNWIIIHSKPNYTGISLNTQYKKEIIEFIEKEMPYLKGIIK